MDKSVSEFINDEYREYSLYVITNRAIPYLTDGLKPVQRRVMYVAKTEANTTTKVNTLAGKLAPIHPHGDAPVEGAIVTLAQNFVGANNYPMLEGEGNFGSRLAPTPSQSRYIKVKTHKNANDILYVDYNLVKMIPNYDGEEVEPKNFLPLVPICIINGIQGIAVGFATNILPHKLSDVVSVIQDVINGKKPKDILPYFDGFTGKVRRVKDTNNKFVTTGVYTRNGKNITITEFPIGTTKEQIVKLLTDLTDKKVIKGFDNLSTKGKFKFEIRGYTLPDTKIVETFKLEKTLTQNITMIDTFGKLHEYDTVVEALTEFANWRVAFYSLRYVKLIENTNRKLDYAEQKAEFIKFVIKNNYVKKMQVMNKEEVKNELVSKFSDIDRLIDMPVSSFTQDNIKAQEAVIKELTKKLKEYTIIYKSENKLRKAFIDELDRVSIY